MTEEAKKEEVTQEVAKETEPGWPYIPEAGMYIGSPGWDEWVLEQLYPHEVEMDEKENKFPKTAGLRRLAEQLLGPISSIITNVVAAPNEMNQSTSTVVVEVTFGAGAYGIWDGGRRYSGSADAGGINLSSVYAKHPTATAETKAEGRAYKRALRVCSLYTSEEMNASERQEATNSGGVKPMQKQHILRACTNEGNFAINMTVEEVTTQVLGNAKEVDDLNYEEAVQLLGFINMTRNNK